MIVCQHFFDPSTMCPERSGRKGSLATSRYLSVDPVSPTVARETTSVRSSETRLIQVLPAAKGDAVHPSGAARRTPMKQPNAGSKRDLLAI